MKREFLEGLEVNGAKLPKEVVDSIMDENGKDVKAGKDALAAKEQQLTTMTEERDGLKNQITERDKDIKDLRKTAGDNQALTTQLNDLQTKYDNDTAALQKKLSDQSRDFATEKFFSQFEFTSELAKKAAIAEFKEQKFEQDDKGEFRGGKEWVDKLKESNPAAFKVETKPDDKKYDGNGGNGGAGGGNFPTFVAPTGNKGNGGGGDNPFNFSFSGVRPQETK